MKDHWELGSERHTGLGDGPRLRARPYYDAPPNRQAPVGRVCRVCTTILSRYNREDYCALHTPPAEGTRWLDKSPTWAAHATYEMWRAGCECSLCLDPVARARRGKMPGGWSYKWPSL